MTAADPRRDAIGKNSFRLRQLAMGRVWGWCYEAFATGSEGNFHLRADGRGAVGHRLDVSSESARPAAGGAGGTAVHLRGCARSAPQPAMANGAAGNRRGR